MASAKDVLRAPKLIPKDPIIGVAPIVFQFDPEGLTENVGGAWSEASTATREHPITQFSSGQARKIVFTARLFAETKVDDVRLKVAVLKQSVKYNSKLGRPPLWIFNWGDFLIDTVAVESIGGVRYGPLRHGFGIGGGPKWVVFRITLRHYEEYGVELTDPDAPPADTFYHTVKGRDTWEKIAAHHYGDARYGELLRRENPDKPFLQVGQNVKVLRFERLRGVLISPSSIPLQRTTEGISARNAIFETRGVARVSHVIRWG